ncbi:hypothetical protein ScalyP_jg4065 [Parmales sp. scaly parma]|jgi:hypothetical protein|nr:hypothetical protein ScalyP_jg4065 [Parmales sp. scaly parma]
MNFYSSSQQHNGLALDHTKPSKPFFTATLLISVFFWTWATINTITKQMFDLGVVSFLSVIITSTFYLYEVSIPRKLIFFSHIFVALNYLLGFVYASFYSSETVYVVVSQTTVYFGIFSVGWFCSSCMVLYLTRPPTSSTYSAPPDL